MALDSLHSADEQVKVAEAGLDLAQNEFTQVYAGSPTLCGSPGRDAGGEDPRDSVRATSGNPGGMERNTGPGDACGGANPDRGAASGGAKILNRAAPSGCREQGNPCQTCNFHKNGRSPQESTPEGPGTFLCQEGPAGNQKSKGIV